ncbi:carboxy-S-adenosyl-L-methionine synthase CmoA [Maribellus maritimus]|uniref:carboxy-S-adenosyl-L-methionine synthase CmoA n=1 Tax=Maribellus maritimus TaxID=2870838 RepID=UPI001EEC9BD0|nr:carboxy-S-adenosyl-L-methionine synthase CmoA [Maribellus maritimus]MCG6190386.1 carboxy-S-adenosyl-L-methionine synthase CmoA [Maribellus maritimus]
MKDNIFKSKLDKSTDFTFDEKVTKVFDDMVVRSVPFYLEAQRMIAELTKDYAKPNTNVYDLGCSTGTTFLNLDMVLDPAIGFVGIDSSAEMLAQCKSNLISSGIQRKFDLIEADLNTGIHIDNASVVVLCLTLQFVRPPKRTKLLQAVYEQLNPGGCVILFEKVLGESQEFNRQFIKYYYDYKRRNNYNEMEIAQKREALENVLIPYKPSENIETLEEIGFQSVETFFKWYNFSGFVALK